MAKDVWPDWWEWEIELTPHLLKRMVDRSFSEVDLRLMLEEASEYFKDKEEALDNSLPQGRPVIGSDFRAVY